MSSEDEAIAERVRQKMLTNKIELELEDMRSKLAFVAEATGRELYLKSIKHDYDEEDGVGVVEMEIHVAHYAEIETLTLKVEE